MKYKNVSISAAIFYPIIFQLADIIALSANPDVTACG